MNHCKWDQHQYLYAIPVKVAGLMLTDETQVCMKCGRFEIWTKESYRSDGSDGWTYWFQATPIQVQKWMSAKFNDKIQDVIDDEV